MSTMSSVIQRIEQALSQPKRNIMISIVLVAIGAGALMVGNWRARNAQIDLAYQDGISSAVAFCSKTLAAVFGEPVPGAGESGYGMRVYESELDTWVELDETDRITAARVVVLVHGLDEPGGIWDQLSPALAGDDHTVVRFDYPNDQPIAHSASSFLESLGGLNELGVERIDLVCHSMGGLVVRDAITRDGFSKQSIVVDRLVTIGTPFGGSPWARLRAVAEIREQVQRWMESDDLDPKRLLGFARDGVGQAGTDLLPGSDFLVELDSRALPAGIEITCIVGRTLREPGDDLGSMLATGAMNDLIGERDAGVIQKEFEKISNELGDGVVPISSAVLEGVDDVVELNANHRGLIRNIELSEAIRELNNMAPSPEPPAIEIVLDRLRRP